MSKDFAHRIKELRAEVEALKTASRSDSDGLNTVTKTINMTAKLIVHSTYVEGDYFVKMTPETFNNQLVFSFSQKHTVVSDDVIIDSVVPRLKDGEIGAKMRVRINNQRMADYLSNYQQGDIIQKPISFSITASDDFTYTITEDN